MSYRLEFRIDALPTMANIASGRSHWRYAHNEATKWRNLVWDATFGKIPKGPLKRVKLTLTRHSSIAPDYDGLTRGFKSVVDGLRHCGVIENDKLENTGAWDCRWEKAPPKKGFVTVIVEEIE